VVVFCDPRIVDKPYGRVFRASLPPLPVTREARDAEGFLRRIAGLDRGELTRAPVIGAMNGEPA
jgi:ATP-dependent DNA helicase DinG